MAVIDDTLTSKAGAAEAAPAFADQRSDPRAPDDIEVQDISNILLGAKAITGKALTAAGRMTVGEEARLHTLRNAQRRQAQEERELANLARWNAQKTVVGGVEMTNEQAQKARQNVIANDEAYADWAVRKGLIREDQKEEFKAGIRLKMELEDKRGRGTLTAGDAENEARLDRSDAGKAIGAATAYSYENKGIAPSTAATTSNMDGTLRGSADVLNRPGLFQSAPDAGAAFQTASSPEADRKPPPPPATSPAIKATGLDL